MSEVSEEAGDQPNPFDQHPGVDWLLARLVNFAELDLSISVTLTVGGLIISGNVISGRKYFEAVASKMKSANLTGDTDPSIPENLEKLFLSFREVYPKPSSEGPPIKPAFIHLGDARVVMGGGQVVGGGDLFWRIKLASVDSCSFGSFSNS